MRFVNLTADRAAHTPSPAERIYAAKLDMVRQVRTQLYVRLGVLDNGPTSRALDTPIETMMGWVLPNESLMSNVNTVMAMVRQLDNPADPFAGIPGADDDTETR